MTGRAADSKPLASLTSSLLARKGQARPAMRPQVYDPVTPHEDLGWDDMGQEPLALSPPVAAHVDVHPAPDALPLPVRQQAQIAEGLGVVSEGRVASLTPRIISRAKGGTGGKAAFTLRLDATRHLRLRLACAVSQRSAQALVTQALDEFLKTMPELDDVARGMAQDRG